ncbi:MAG TPA: hypothetical protein VGM59_18560, partial [Dongiaceae bacterium]
SASGMTTMQIPAAAEPTPQSETAQLRAEIHRMADMVSSVVRSTALDSTTAAMAIAASGTPKEARKVARQILDRATVMEGEIERFLSIAANHGAA